MSGTDKRYNATRRGCRVTVAALPRPNVAVCERVSVTSPLSAYALATRCPVLTQRVLLLGWRTIAVNGARCQPTRVLCAVRY
eukprot:2954765-Rhodomonas_salina.2